MNQSMDKLNNYRIKIKKNAVVLNNWDIMRNLLV